MKVKMVTGLSGPDYSLSPGDEHEFGEAEAKRLIEAGFAVSLADAPKRASSASAAKTKG